METVFLSLTKSDFQDLIAETITACLRRHTPAPQPYQIETNYLTREQACKRLGGISLPTLAEYTKSGVLKGKRIGRRVLYCPADIDAALTAIKTNGIAGRSAL